MAGILNIDYADLPDGKVLKNLVIHLMLLLLRITNFNLRCTGRLLARFWRVVGFDSIAYFFLRHAK